MLCVIYSEARVRSFWKSTRTRYVPGTGTLGYVPSLFFFEKFFWVWQDATWVRLDAARVQAYTKRLASFFFSFLFFPKYRTEPYPHFLSFANSKTLTPPHFQLSPSHPPAINHHHSTTPPQVTGQRWQCSSSHSGSAPHTPPAMVLPKSQR